MDPVADGLGLLASQLERRWLGPRGQVCRPEVVTILRRVGLADGSLPEQIVRRLNNPWFRRELRRRPRPELDVANNLPELIAKMMGLLDEVILQPAGELAKLLGRPSNEVLAVRGHAARANAELANILPFLSSEQPAASRGRPPTQASRPGAMLAADIVEHAQSHGLRIAEQRACELACDLIALALGSGDDWLAVPKAASVKDVLRQRKKNTNA